MKKILLLDLDGKNPNLALMKISAHHKAKGNSVFLNFSMGDYDEICASCVFPKNYKNINNYAYSNIQTGGSGIDINKKLPDEIEFIKPDYSLYNIDYGVGFLSRGCVRKCPWCIVPQKEGKLKEWQDPEEFVNEKSNKIVLYDNNFLALPNHNKWLQKMVDKKWRIDINQGMDIRLIDEENAGLLKKMKRWKPLRFAWDSMDYEKDVRRGIEILKKAGINNSQFYLLSGFNTTLEEDKYRFEVLRGLGVSPFVMTYDFKKQPKIIQEFGRWGTMPYFWRNCPFDSFLKYRQGNYDALGKPKENLQKKLF